MTNLDASLAPLGEHQHVSDQLEVQVEMQHTRTQREVIATAGTTALVY